MVMTQGRESRQVNSGEMARDLEDAFQISLQTLINVTEKSGNLRKDLRDDIMKSVSTLRGVYNAIMSNLGEKARKLDSLGSRTDNTSVVIPEVTTQIEKKKMYSEVLSGNKQENAE